MIWFEEILTRVILILVREAQVQVQQEAVCICCANRHTAPAGEKP